MDTKAKIKMLVQQVVEAYIKEQLLKKKNDSITILLGYQSPKPLDVLEAISPLVNAYDVTLLLTKDWLQAPTQMIGHSFYFLEELDQRELLSIMEKTSLLVVPASSFQLLSKLALTIDDEIGVWLAIQYQLVGKPVVIANNFIELTLNQQIQAPNSVQERIQSYIRQIRNDQVSWVPLNKLSTTVERQLKQYREKQHFILERHIEKAHTEGLMEIAVPKKSKVTPAAKDLAKELNIHITKLGSSKGG